ncbi:2'-5'-oligoadenylate synthase 1A-like [Lacerta agilis]|uniref:2'-5'-oligoadenylate synthase 1A-like n=1 Tax=Lacerta agilis TaxID=80427 RepID=UPI0014192E7A|nr:2'-5'-oligoadenylate synthase 1A-like [Lacerta agilis]
MALPRMWGVRPRSYNCERCGNDFVSRTALRYHFQAKHLGRVHCETCGKEVLRECLLQHAKTDHEMILTSNHRSYWDMTRNRRTKFVATETLTSCRMCPRQFGTAHAREYHEKQEHHFTASKRAQMSTAFKPENILEYKTPAELTKFVEAKLRPISNAVRWGCASEVEKIIEFIEEVFPLPITYVTKGGSYIKGTDVQDSSDVDIVIFSSAFQSLEDCQRKIPEVLEELGKGLIKPSWINRVILQERTPFSLRFYFKCYKDHHGHFFDIMPCYDMFGPTLSAGLKESFYGKLYRCSDSDKIQLYTMALLKYQVEFVKASTERVKDLIRLMKHWFKTSFATPREENKFRRLPSSYAVELITIYVWELAGKPMFFSYVQGMRAILKILVQYQEICAVWHKHYRPNFPIFQKVFLKQTRPFVLDPANPTFNVCENSNAWDEVAHVARQSLLKPLFNGIQAKEPWLFAENW